ncbi:MULTISPECIES: glutathione S-transferase [Rhizobium]|uniref:Glutathione S-transferase n=1 Tax=Rhizobium tropici TaxID=398 RepID=A0A6P1C5N8_RHITR|nr:MULTISPECIES: glutathione S-transferase [Rhizobium]AGB70668.1 glutathione S-transferase protein [Rhizobium tropici CIAT 899]MBB4241618.1 glutathione S-transferase [Rhizobium tropici]MBB5592641.1 glutathione S-transferase [Rhizobium tropici]MBB6491683.1 glutathione S-transferase [Rhizobium tropici]NEV10903.1 glutathione S-transferase [Rhizobium tropici]
MRLLCSPTSPFSSKVRMAARHLGIKLAEIHVDTNAGPTLLIDNNPLGKIPTLLTDDGEAIFDSRAIMHYFDRREGGLYPSKKGKRTEIEVLEALIDGTNECLLSIVYERRLREPEKQHQPWIDRQWTKVSRALTHLDAEPPKIGKKLHAGHFALASLVGYLQLRFEGQWEADHAELVAWAQKFEKRFPDFPAMKPQV